MPQNQPPTESIRLTIRNFFRSTTLQQTLSDWKWILSFSKKHWLAITVQTLLGLAVSALGLVSSLAGKYLIDSILAVDHRRVLGTVVLAVGCALVSLLVQSITARFGAKLTMHNEVHAHVFDRLMHSDWMAMRQFSTGDLLSRFSSDVSTVASCAVSWLPSFVIQAFTLLCVLLILLYFDPIMALIGCISTPVLFLASRSLIRHQRSYNMKMRQASSRISSFESETFRNIDTIKGFGVEDSTVDQLHHWQSRYRSVALEYNAFHIRTNALLSTMSTAVQYLAMGYCFLRLWQGDMEFGTMGLFLQLRNMLQSSFSALVGLIPQALNGSVCAERARALSELEQDAPPAANTPASPCGLHLQQVSVSYEDGIRVLRDITLQADAGEIIALVGPSGEGKTTLFRLLLGLLRPDEGTITLIGPDGSQPLTAGTRGYFSYVPQGNTLLAGTIADNLRFACPDATDAQIIEALRNACAWEFVSQIPGTIHAPLGEGGQGLSEGQAQRIAIARALLRHAPIMLLDEVTSALDMATEREVLDHLMNLGVTCIVSTHRPSVLSMCTRVYRIDDGRLTQLRDDEIRTLVAGI